MSLKNFSTTPADNQIGTVPEKCPEGWALSSINAWGASLMADVRSLAASNTIASAATCDLGSLNETFLTITGTTTITSFGTVSDGIYKFVTFSGALTLTYNATSLILPGAANITTVAGDTAMFRSLGAGNWKCMQYERASGAPIGGALTPSNNLSDVASASTARTNLGLGTAATVNTGTASGNVPLVGTNSATELLAGTVELATSAEAQALTDALKALTPATLAAALQGGNQSLATNGYQKLPGGLIIQWASIAGPGANTSFTWTFPIAFPNACRIVLINGNDATTTPASASPNSAPTTSSVSLVSSLAAAKNHLCLAIGN